MLKPSLDKRERWIRNPLDEEYSTDNDRVARKIAQRAEEWEEMTRFVATDKCLMQFMRRSLGDATWGFIVLGGFVVKPGFSKAQLVSFWGFYWNDQ